MKKGKKQHQIPVDKVLTIKFIKENKHYSLSYLK
mgnify:CR=1 FL=1